MTGIRCRANKRSAKYPLTTKRMYPHFIATTTESSFMLFAFFVYRHNFYECKDTTNILKIQRLFQREAAPGFTCAIVLYLSLTKGHKLCFSCIDTYKNGHII